MACFGLNLLGIAVWLSVQKLLLLRGVPYLPLIVLTYAIGAAAVAVTAAAAFLRRPAVWPLSTSGLLALGSRPRVQSVAPAHEAPATLQPRRSATGAPSITPPPLCSGLRAPLRPDPNPYPHPHPDQATPSSSPPPSAIGSSRGRRRW